MTYTPDDKNNPTLAEMRARTIAADRSSCNIDCYSQKSWEMRVWEFAVLRGDFIYLLDEVIKLRDEVNELKKGSKS